MPRLIQFSTAEARELLLLTQSRRGLWRETPYGWKDPETCRVLSLNDAYRLAYYRQRKRSCPSYRRQRLAE